MSDTYPEGLVVTKIGTLRVMANGRHTFYVSSDTNERTDDGQRISSFLTVRGVQYRASLHLENVGNGAGYQPAPDKYGNTYNALYCSRNDHRDVSAAGRNSLVEAMTTAALEWLKANPDAPFKAGVCEETNRAERLTEEIDTLEAKIQALKTERAACVVRAEEYRTAL